jgi:hypothetical protein
MLHVPQDLEHCRMWAKQRRDTTRWVCLLALPREHVHLEHGKNENKIVFGGCSYLQPIKARES